MADTAIYKREESRKKQQRNCLDKVCTENGIQMSKEINKIYGRGLCECRVPCFLFVVY